MAKLARLTGQQVIAALKRAGFEVLRVKGSHHFLVHADGRRTVVPVHRGGSRSRIDAENPARLRDGTRRVHGITEMKKEYDFSKGKRGAVVRAPKGKTRITIRIDDDILEWFRGEVDAAGGGNYQTLINSALREHITRQQEPIEVILRRVVREELHSVSQ